METVRWMMDALLSPVCFLIILVVQLKIIRTLRSHTGLIMFYGKQIEEIRKAIGGFNVQHRMPESSPEEHGLYEVLNE